jgi:hypothetical protein
LEAVAKQIRETENIPNASGLDDIVSDTLPELAKDYNESREAGRAASKARRAK